MGTPCRSECCSGGWNGKQSHNSSGRNGVGLLATSNLSRRSPVQLDDDSSISISGEYSCGLTSTRLVDNDNEDVCVHARTSTDDGRSDSTREVSAMGVGAQPLPATSEDGSPDDTSDVLNPCPPETGVASVTSSRPLPEDCEG
jgi:hypothetical protein